MVKEIYQATSKVMASEIFGLTNRIRRAAVSGPANIAEGHGRNSAKEFRQLLFFGLGSRGEPETQLIIAHETGYLTAHEQKSFLANFDRIRNMMKSLSNSIT